MYKKGRDHDIKDVARSCHATHVTTIPSFGVILVSVVWRHEIVCEKRHLLFGPPLLFSPFLLSFLSSLGWSIELSGKVEGAYTAYKVYKAGPLANFNPPIPLAPL